MELKQLDLQTKTYSSDELDSKAEEIWQRVKKSGDVVIEDKKKDSAILITGIGSDSDTILDYMALCIAMNEHPDVINQQGYSQMTTIDSKVNFLRKSFEKAGIKVALCDRKNKENFEIKNFAKAVWRAIKKGKMVELSDGETTAVAINCKSDDVKKSVEIAQNARVEIAMENLRLKLKEKGVNLSNEEIIKMLKDTVMKGMK